MVHPENAKCFVCRFSQSQSTTEEECGVGRTKFLLGKAPLGRLKEGAPPIVSGTRRRRGGSPKAMLLKAVLCQGAEKMYRTQAGKEIEGYNFFKKMMQQQFKMPKKTTVKKEGK